MNSEYRTKNSQRGIVLLVTMVVLLVLATVGYHLASRVAAQRHRDNYIIDYTTACYARDSAVKYAMATLQDLNNIELVDRPNEPDFSDLFGMKEEKYQELLKEWGKELAKRQIEEEGQTGGGSTLTDMSIDEEEPLPDEVSEEDLLDIGETYESNEVNSIEPNAAEVNTVEQVKIRGPYGPEWPYVAEPVEFDIGTAKVKIEIEDENAKYPLGWAILGDEKVQREAQAGFETFCEWMDITGSDEDLLKEQLGQVSSIRPFKMEFRPVTQRTAVALPATPAVRRRGTRPQRTSYRTTTISPAEQAARQARDFSRLFHSSLVDTELLARPTIESETRKESALKYMSLWGTTQVNINSAPRQVLESALVFGGDAQRVADGIIRQRKEKPFINLEDAKKKLFSYSTQLDKCKDYITTASSVFSIHVTAYSGTAKASAVIVVFKNGNKIERIAVISG
jgi:hypothetical protein